MARHKGPCYATLYVIVLHLEDEVAARSGLFSPDDRIKLVDVDDAETIRSYFDLWASNVKDKDLMSGVTFNIILSRETFLARVNTWLETANFTLLAAAWLDARKQKSHLGDDAENIWIPRIRNGHVPHHVMNTPNADHEWVRRTREELPTLVPKIMFWCFLAAAICDPIATQPNLNDDRGQNVTACPVYLEFSLKRQQQGHHLRSFACHCRQSHDHSTTLPNTPAMTAAAAAPPATPARAGTPVTDMRLLKDKGRDAQPPIEDLLPPLTSRNDVDLQLYAFLAIIMREFIQSWYGKITTDETFVAEIVHIIAHCTTALEQRFRKLDLESLILDEIPDLLDRHATAHRAAHRPVSQAPVRVNPREVYHSLCPLPALSPVPQPDDPTTSNLQGENEAAYRQLLVQAVLAILLPTEDLENPCLTALVGQILSELIIGNVIANKASQPWLLYEAICITARSLEEQKVRATARIVSGTHEPSSIGRKAKKSQNVSVQGFFVLIIHLGILFISTIRFFARTLADSVQLPPRTKVLPNDEYAGSLPMYSDHAPDKVPVLSFKIWSCFGNLIELNERKPWLSGFMSLLQTAAVHGPWRIAGLNGPLDRLLSHHIQSIFDPTILPPILRSLRGALFPNNSPGTSTLVAPSSEEELSALRRRAARAVWGLLPKGVSRAYFGGRPWRRGGSGSESGANAAVAAAAAAAAKDEDETLLDDLESLLMVVGDEYCNKHLMYSVLELILVRLMPELSDKGVVELWEDRLG
ncbi:hypothetical protein PT974_08321 [Cladobotryum mycophilum]|uniref:PXA domain-containing protein n=1 Tax=Cladobotryum mycophilum TaxID=491253 RepID=A0ABR0SD30_9HYPO